MWFRRSLASVILTYALITILGGFVGVFTTPATSLADGAKVDPPIEDDTLPDGGDTLNAYEPEPETVDTWEIMWASMLALI
jgi:hypothetical protein